MTFELTRIKQRLADLEKNQGFIQQRLRVDSEHKSTTNQRLVQLEKNQNNLLKIISEINSTMEVIQKQINIITQKNTGKDHP